MGIADAFCAEDRVPVKFTDFYTLMRESANAELIQNAVKCRVPHEHIWSMITGKPDLPGKA